MPGNPVPSRTSHHTLLEVAWTVVPAILVGYRRRNDSMSAACETMWRSREHVMAALAGLQIDNCLVELDAAEPPIGDGSSLFAKVPSAATEAMREHHRRPRPTWPGRAGAAAARGWTRWAAVASRSC